jgi:hypothetical protein
VDWAKALDAWTRQWWTYIDWCLAADMGAPVCRPFWTWVTIGCGAAGALGLAYALGKFVSYRIKLAAALKAEEERQRVR